MQNGSNRHTSTSSLPSPTPPIESGEGFDDVTTFPIPASSNADCSPSPSASGSTTVPISGTAAPRVVVLPEQSRGEWSTLPEVLPRRTTERSHRIYALIDPRDDSCRYIGMTTDPDRRLREHVRSARFGDCHNFELEVWLGDLFRYCMQPRMVILETVERSQWSCAEKWWIAWGRRRGRLYNLENGGHSRRRKRKHANRKSGR